MPHIILLEKAGQRSYRVDSAEAVVGRDPNAAVVLQSEGAAVVSGRHARLTRADGHWWVEDIGSRNGTFVGGRRLGPGDRYRLAVGDEISFGATGPRLRVEEAVGRSLATTMDEPAPAVSGRTVTESRPATAEPPMAPTLRQSVRLVLKTQDGKRLAGQDTEVIIGRSNDSTIRVEGDMSLAVSRRHARVFYSGWKICIEDAGSRNGTWLNRKRVMGPTVLSRKDVIEFGAGGPSLTVEDVALMSGGSGRRTKTEMQPPLEAESPFVSELPTPAARPAVRASGEHK